MEINNKIIFLSCRRTKIDGRCKVYKYKPFSVGFSYSEYFGKMPIEEIIKRLDKAYVKLKEHLVEELKEDEEYGEIKK